MKITFWDWMTANQDVLGIGSGLYCTLHLVLIAILFAWLIAVFFIFKHFPKFSKIFIKTMAWFMIISRLFRMIFRICVGADSFFEAMPWQLCHIMCFVIGIMILLNIKKRFVTPIAMFAFFGGILTFLFGDYYTYSILTFYDIESILLHIMLPTAAIWCIVSKKVTYTYASIFQTFIFMILLVCYGEIGNTIFKTTNIMFIRKNGLPFKIFPGAHHIFTYMLLVFSAYALATITLAFMNYFKARKRKNFTAENILIQLRKKVN